MRMWTALLAIVGWTLTASAGHATEFAQEGRYKLVFSGTVASDLYSAPDDNGLFDSADALLAGLPITITLLLHIAADTAFDDPKFHTDLGGLNQPDPLQGTIALAGVTHVLGAGFEGYDTLSLLRKFNYAQFPGSIDAVEIDAYRVKLVNQQALGDDLSLAVASQTVDFLKTGDIRKPLFLKVPAGVDAYGSYTYTDGQTLASVHFGISQVSISMVPEPSGWQLLIVGCAVIGGAARRRSRRATRLPAD